MNICVIGWYGTETLGDRAIFDGIVSVFQELSDDNSYYVGSLFPIVTKRTFFEDASIYSNHGGESHFYCFDVKNKAELKAVLEETDVVIMGGGPLMDIQEMYTIERVFRKAHNKKLPTILFGCGFGPLRSREYRGCLKRILSTTDLVIMRSSRCKSAIQQYTNKEVVNLCDPALISVMNYKQSYGSKLTRKTNKSLVMNFRDINYVYHEGRNYVSEVAKLVERISGGYSNVFLYPMHTFAIGGDDRVIENKIAALCATKNLSVINKPLSLIECYEMIASATCCVGTRYHSIVFQTILNGNNYILDYTDKKNGKISSFLDEYGLWNFYGTRYINLLGGRAEDLTIAGDKSFAFNIAAIQKDKDTYVHLLKEFLGTKKAAG